MPSFTLPALTDVRRIAGALDMLRDARDILLRAGAIKTAARVRLAITSAKGALLNAQCRAARASRGETRKSIRRAPGIRITTKPRRRT